MFRFTSCFLCGLFLLSGFSLADDQPASSLTPVIELGMSSKLDPYPAAVNAQANLIAYCIDDPDSDSSARRKLIIITTPNAHDLPDVALDDAFVYNLRFSPDGSSLAISWLHEGTTNKLSVVDLTTWQMTTRPYVSLKNPDNLEQLLSPDRLMQATVKNIPQPGDQPLLLVVENNSYPLYNSPPMRLGPNETNVRFLRFKPDSSVLVACSYRVRYRKGDDPSLIDTVTCWNPRKGKRLARYVFDDQVVHDAQFDASGQLLMLTEGMTKEPVEHKTLTLWRVD